MKFRTCTMTNFLQRIYIEIFIAKSYLDYDSIIKALSVSPSPAVKWCLLNFAIFLLISDLPKGSLVHNFPFKKDNAIYNMPSNE